MNPFLVILSVILSMALLIGSIMMTIYVLRRLNGTKSTRRTKKAGQMPDDEHQGKEAIVRMLNRYAATHEYQVIEPVCLTGSHGTTDLDALLVGWFGILGVKCLGYGGDIYGSLEEEDWVQTVNGVRRSFVNPMTRAQQSARVIRDVLFDANIKNTPVETLVVFTRKNAQLMLPRSTGHYTEKSFAAYLKSMHFEEDKNVQVKELAQLLRSKNAD